MKKKFNLFGLLMCLILVTYSLKAQTNSSNNKTVEGKITYLGNPVKNVNIRLKGTSRGTKTNTNGNYTIKANIGDILLFSHVSYKQIEIVVEDITQTLNLELSLNLNQLNETVVTSRKKINKALEYSKAKTKKINTAIGEIDLLAYGFTSNYAKGEDLPKHCDGIPNGASPLLCAANAKFFSLKRGLGTLLWDIDGAIYDSPPPHFLASQVEEMWYLTQAPAGYGSKRVIIVQTIAARSFGENDKKEIEESYKNQNYYQEDAKPLSDEFKTLDNSIESNTLPSYDLKKVRGIVTLDASPLSNVNIKILESSKGTVTDAQGNYEMEVRIGDELEFSYQGMHKVNIIIEDITAELNIDMVPNINSLEEVKIIAKNLKGEVLKRSENAEKTFTTSRGNYNPKKLGYSIGYIDGQKINFALYPSLREAMRGKIAGLYIDNKTGIVYLRGKTSSINQDYPVSWEVDGNFTSEEPVGLDLNNIKSIHLLKGLAATNKYGTSGAGGVIVITTNMGSSHSIQTNGVNQKITNNNFYVDDAKNFNENDYVQSAVISNLKKYTNRAFAYNFYKENIQNQVREYHKHINISNLFNSHFKDSYKANEILMTLAEKHHENPEILKAIAYQYQAVGAKREAVNIYEQIFKLRPSYAQSYRDLANAYVEYDQFKQAWNLYLRYLLQGHNATEEGIGQTIYSEMEFLHFNRKNQTQIKELFQPKSKNLIDFRNDIRIVVEWNTSEAEFDLEFVASDKRAYVFEHTLVANQELITDEKQKGYSSKEFFIEDVGTGEWLMNFTYLGNKKYDPTYFKVTTYYHWGKPTQRQDVSVYAFKNEREKIQLFKVHKKLLLASK